jgi:TPR repeat protein/tRNA A-37 threonylcarbamoyl transferase component Bud32
MEEDLFWEYPKLQLDISNTPLPVEGAGAYGIVHKVTYDNKVIALKKIRTSRRILKKDPKTIEKIKREINVMEILKDVHQIVQFIGIYISEHYVFIGMQFAENKSLYDHIQQEKQNLDWKYIKQFTYDVALGLWHLHNIHVYHGDIKAHNILLDSGFRAKLCDFGTSKNDDFSINAGTNNRWSPERKNGECKPDKDDIYALGLLMVEMSSFKLYNEEFNSHSIEDVLSNKDIPRDFLNVLTSFMKNEKDRPFAKQAVDKLGNITENITIKNDLLPKQSNKDQELLVNADDDEYAIFKEIEKKALAGDVSSQSTLGKYYHSGYGTEKNYEQAKLWHTKAAEAGNVNAQHNLGIYYREIEKNYEQAKLWHTKAAETGNSNAQSALGYYYYHIEENYEQAKPWWTKAAEAGDAEAQNRLGYYYYHIEESYEQAKLWWTKAVEAGHINAQYNLGVYYYANEKNYEQAKSWYTKAAEAGDVDAQYALGFYYYHIEENYEQAKSWYIKAAEAGNVDAQYALGFYYTNIEKNYEQTKRWYTKAAESGNVIAQYNLGIYFYDIEKDYEQAKSWYTKAVEAGNAGAQNGLGYYYKDIEGDYDKAKEMYLLAINQGDTNAMHSLGQYYQDIEKDYGKAMEWYKKSIEAGLDHGYGEQGIGHCHHHNENTYKAKEWYLKAIDKGCIEAYTDIGQIYLSEGDKEAAFEWCLKGAEAGDENAKEKLQEINKACILS